jgi:hypothetical protein
MENERTVRENLYEAEFMKRHGEKARAEYEKRMKDEWGKQSFAFYDAEERVHTIDFRPGICSNGLLLDDRYPLGLERTREQDAEIYRMNARFWTATCIQAVAVLALAVTVLLHIL